MTLRWMPAAAFGGKFKAPAATFVVVHCTESDNNPGTAESLAGPNWFGGSKAGTSAHRMFDRDSGVEMVRGTNVAYHAGPGGNTWGRSYEFCGRAEWSAAKWREPEQLAELKLAAPYIAQDLIEITGSKTAALAACRWLSVVQVAAKAHGLCTHNDIRLALGGTTHSDPGPNFPYAELLSYVRAALTGTPQEDDVLSPDQDAMLRFVYNRISGRDVQRWMKQEPNGDPIITGPEDRDGWPARSVDIADILQLRKELLAGDQQTRSVIDAAGRATVDVAALKAALLPDLEAALLKAGPGATADQLADALAVRLAA